MEAKPQSHRDAGPSDGATRLIQAPPRPLRETAQDVAALSEQLYAALADAGDGLPALWQLAVHGAALRLDRVMWETHHHSERAARDRIALEHLSGRFCDFGADPRETCFEKYPRTISRWCCGCRARAIFCEIKSPAEFQRADNEASASDASQENKEPKTEAPIEAGTEAPSETQTESAAGAHDGPSPAERV